MDALVVDCGRLLLPEGEARDQRLLIVQGKIQAIAAHLDAPSNARYLDARRWIVAPGFVDIHVHGAVGADTMDASQEALSRMAAFFARHGVTAFLPTTMTASDDAIQNALLAVRVAQQRRPFGERILGVHLEGPFIAPSRAGAQPTTAIRLPSPESYRLWLSQGVVQLITLAPEIEGCSALIAECVAQNISVALGHSEATFEQTLRAFDLGVNQLTHTFNAMRGLHHREPGPIGAALMRESVYLQVIADGVHVHPAMLRLLYRCFGADRLVVITDAMSATGVGDGVFKLGGQDVFVKGGVARLRDGALAGSTLTMDQAFRTMLSATGCTLAEAARMCATTPARAIGLTHKGQIALGCDADLVLLDEHLSVKGVLVKGEVVELDRSWTERLQ